MSEENAHDKKFQPNRIEKGAVYIGFGIMIIGMIKGIDNLIHLGFWIEMLGISRWICQRIKYLINLD